MSISRISERINKSGLTYAKFLELTQQKLSDDEFKKNEKYDVTKLNLQRSNRIYKTYTVSEQVKELIHSINKPQIWMVITEDWCGDSAQNLPYIVKIAELNSLIELRILLRYQNLDIMDMYLTNGKSRSIPKLVAFDKDGNELFQWGPRPKEAQLVVDLSIKNGLDKNAYLEKLHLWYSEDKGQTL
ncbi:MAG: thioredoxin family protein, partial [Ignavibacteria bacterium]|nr:thioredoxin family protein [Ignavibacteria bacterium]